MRRLALLLALLAPAALGQFGDQPLYWAPPVASVGALPTCDGDAEGQVRLVKDIAENRACISGSWVAAPAASTDTTCLDAGVSCLFAASPSEGGGALSLASGATTTDYVDWPEIADPSAPGSDTLRMWASAEDGHTLIRTNDENGVSIELGQDRVHIVRNSTGSDLLKGQVVYFTGATGNRPTAGLARADSISTLPAIGVVRSDISNNDTGLIQTAGDLSNLDTSSWAEGAELYLSDSVAGGLTATKPSAPSWVQHVATVLVSHPSNGVLDVSADHPRQLGCLDANEDGNCEVLADGTTVGFDSDGDGTVDTQLGTGTDFLVWNPANGDKLGYSFNNQLRVYFGNTWEWNFSNQALCGADGREPCLELEVASLTNPTVNPYGGDDDTGLGADGSDTLSLIAGGTAVLTVDNDGTDHLALIECASTQTGDCVQVNASGGAAVLKFDSEGRQLDIGASGEVVLLGGTSPQVALTSSGGSSKLATGTGGNTFFHFTGGNFSIRGGSGGLATNDVVRVQDAGGLALEITSAGTATFTPDGATAALTVSTNGVDIGDQGTKPTCDSTTRGNLWTEEGGAGVADTLEICLKSAADAYSWVNIATG